MGWLLGGDCRVSLDPPSASALRAASPATLVPPEWTQRQVHSPVHRRRWRKRGAGGLSPRDHVEVRRAVTAAVDVEGGTGPSPPPVGSHWSLVSFT